MQSSFYFYDLETSGISPRSSRVMQFAGQRTDMALKPIGEPDIFYIKLTPDILPDPDAILITGITPQKTLDQGVSEAEFLKYFYSKIATPGTIFTGFNSIRFDDEFIRYLNYRNFYDAYEWQWQNDRNKWDILDVSRMTRALRPEAIQWPFDSEGKPTNKLELLAAINKLDHTQAHDAVSDVQATIAMAKLIQQKQPKLFDYLLTMRDKKRIAELVNKPEPFVYTSGRYGGENLSTTVAVTVAPHPTQKGAILVYDLRVDPTKWGKLSLNQLTEYFVNGKNQEAAERLPVKQLQFNRCPAVAPLTVLDEASQERLRINLKTVEKNLKTLLALGNFSDNLQAAVKLAEQKRQSAFVIDIQDVDTQLYDGFFNDDDKDKMQVVRQAGPEKLADLHLDFSDNRLEKLLLLYKARQFPKSLNQDEQKQWDAYRQHKLLGGGDQSEFARFVNRLNELSIKEGLSQEQRYLLEELKFYAESIMPYGD
jgi:exodeoxyribonuclease-1